MRTPQGKLFFIIRRRFPAVIYRTPHCFLRNPSVRRLLQKPFQFPQLIRHILHRICIVCTGSVYGEVGHAVVSCDSAEGVGVCITRQGGVGNQAWLWQHA